MKAALFVHFMWIVLVVSFVTLQKFCSGQSLGREMELIEKRIREMSSFQNEECEKSQWAINYTNFHSNTLNKRKPRVLVVVPSLSGFADRVVGFTTMVMVSILTNRTVQMNRRGVLPTFERAFYSPNINWTRPEDPDWTLEPLRQASTELNYNRTVQESRSYYAVNMLQDNQLSDHLLREGCPFLSASDDKETVFVVNNRGRTIRLFENPAYAKRLKQMELTPYTAFGCLVNFAIQPKPEIFIPVLEQFKIMTEPAASVLKISIHIRAGDHVLLRESLEQGLHQGASAGVRSNAHTTLLSYQSFFACASEIEQWVLADAPPGKYSRVIWYLASDSHAIRRAAVEVFGADKIITSLDSLIEHTSKETFDCVSNATMGGAVGDGSSNDDKNFGSSAGSSRVPLYGTPRPFHTNDKSYGRTDRYTTCAVSETGFNTAAAEWWMLGYAHYHVVTFNSGFGRAGAYRTGNRDNIYTIYPNKPTVCDREGYSQLEELMSDWSGI